jgi:long-subunit fatty acid transport protein
MNLQPTAIHHSYGLVLTRPAGHICASRNRRPRHRPYERFGAVLDVEGTGVAPTGAIGIQYQLTDATMIGATYTEQTNFWLHGATNASLFPGFLLESRFNSKMQLRWPRSVAVGIKHDLCPHRRISADMVWYD